jgi:hypothetical protein
MYTRAKFRCYSVKKTHTTKWVDHNPVLGLLYDYEFNVVTGDGKDSENDKFFASTPSGKINLSSVRDDLFDPGKDYYIDFTPADIND